MGAGGSGSGASNVSTGDCGGGAPVCANVDRRERWEAGNPDYMGSASFDNILKKIDSSMGSPGELW